MVAAVDAGVNRTRIHACQEACPAWRADRRLTVGVFECRAGFDESVKVWRADVLVAKRVDCVIALLIRAYPKDVRLGCISPARTIQP